MRRCLGVALVCAAACCGPTAGEAPSGDNAEAYARVVCGAIDNCGCYDHLSGDSACEEHLRRRFADLASNDMVLDAACFADVVEDGGIDECLLANSIPDMWGCTVLRGNRKAGESCADHTLELPPFVVNDCQEGLNCVDGACVAVGAVNPPRMVGDVCFAEQSASCHNSELWCASDGLCYEAPAEGEACASPFACKLDYVEDDGVLYCQGLDAAGTGRCERQSKVGEGCDPRDWYSCFSSDTSARSWCDPAAGLCVAASPAVCLATDFPKARGTSF